MLHEVGLLPPAEQQPVVNRRGDQQGRRNGDAQQRDEIDVAVKRRELAEAGVERHHEQEREQNLNAGARDAELVEELDRVAVKPFEL
jgi:hypothetical protein